MFEEQVVPYPKFKRIISYLFIPAELIVCVQQFYQFVVLTAKFIIELENF